MRTESRRKIAPARTTADKPQDAIEIRANITKYTEFERVLQSKMQIPSDASTNASLGKRNVNDMLDYLISQAQLSIGKNTALMTKEDKIAYIHFLDKHGAFLITKSGQRICEALSISKYTLYNYLEISREVAKKIDRISTRVAKIQPHPLTQIVTQVCAKARGHNAQSAAKSRTFR